jgi:hypothetical protein
MSLPAKEILAGIYAVQKQLLRPEDVADAIATGRSPGDTLGVKWDYLCDEAEDRLAAVGRASAPAVAPSGQSAPATPPKRIGPPSQVPLVVGGAITLLAVVGLGVGLAVAVGSKIATANRLGETEAKLAQSQKSEEEAREQVAMARKAVDEAYAFAKENPQMQQPQNRTVRQMMLKTLQPYHEWFLKLEPADKAARAEQAENLLRLGMLVGETGKKDEAEKLLVRARESFSELAKKADDPKPIRADAARASEALGVLYHTNNNLDAALNNLRDARDTYQGVDAAHPGVARVSGQVGVIQWERRRAYEAQASLKAAKKAYSELAEKSPESDRQLAEVCVNLAVVQAAAHDRKSALENAQQAQKLCDELAKKFPDVTTYAHDLALAHLTLGNLYAADKRLPEATAHYAQARAIEQRLNAEYADVAPFQIALADVQRRGADLQRQGRPQDAMANYESACALYLKADADGKSPQCRFGTASAERGVGQVLAARGDFADARKHFAVAELILQPLVKAHPKQLPYQVVLAESLMGSGLAAKEMKDEATATASLNKARELWSNLVREDGEEAAYRLGLADAATQFAGLVLEKQAPEAESALHDAFAALEPLRKAQPPDPDAKRLLRAAYANRAVLRANGGIHRAAAADYDQAATGEPDPLKRLALRKARMTSLLRDDQLDQAYLESARIMTLNAVVALSDSSKPLAVREKEAEPWFLKALDELNKAEEYKELELAKVAKTDPEFAPLREREDFKEWLARLQNDKS